MASKNLTMCNYCAMSNQYGHIVGHSLKVTSEYIDILKDIFEDIRLIATENMIKSFENSCISSRHKLPYEIKVDVPFTLLRRIKDKIGILFNIRYCIKNGGGNIFFYQVEFFLFFYLCFFYRKIKHRKIYILIYHQNFTGGRLESVLQRVYQAGLKKVDGVFYTQRKNVVTHDNAKWIPDYYFDELKYSKYVQCNKKNMVVCMGTMNRYKQLETLIDVFNELDIDLKIIGHFDDYKRFQRLQKLVNANITIDNTVLAEEDYYNIMSESRYVILPYDMKQYEARTSGVLIEAMFLGCIPIAPYQLLELIGGYGVGYDDIIELISKNWCEEELYDVCNAHKIIVDEYSKSRVAEIMREVLCP